jgi:transcription elongation GreA/GreB family factor
MAQRRAKVRDAATPDAAGASALDADARAALADRLAFALTAAKKVDDALYTRLAITVRELQFETPTAAEMRDYLWERRRFIGAARELPAREVGAMVAFLAVDDEARARLCKAIPELTYTAVQEIVAQFATDDVSRKAIADYMRLPKAPATLTVLFAGSYPRFAAQWPELPPFINLLTQAVALGEGRQSGETLRMQNIVRRLFADKAWLEKTFAALGEADRALLFERFQASIAWDPATHHTIVVRMVRFAPELESHVVRAEKKREYARVTSPRSYAQRKRDYLKLINEDMPENVRKIEEAKSYGDLSENAEYQYAKDEQRVLMQKQTLMQAELDEVSSSDFADATTDEVMPGVTVVVSLDAGEERTYTILGEWDNDLERGVISSKTRLAQNMLGKKPGDAFELPQAEGPVAFGRIKEIRPLGDDIRAWMAG